MREQVEVLKVCYQTSVRRACNVLQLQRSSYQYRSRKDEQAALMIRIRDLAQARVSYGYQRIHVLLQREGWKVNHKRVYRLYIEEGLTMRSKRPRRHVSACRLVERPLAIQPSLITVVALTPLFTALPETVLAAIIIYAVSHLMRWQQMQRFYLINPVEFWLGIVALLGVLIIDVLPGLAIAVLFSLAIVLYRSSRPYRSVLGQVPGEPGAYTDIRRHPENKSIPGLLIFRFNSPLYFANASLFHNRLKKLVSRSDPQVKAIIVDMVTNDQLDITSIEMLEKLAVELERNGTEIMVAEVHQPVREIARRSGLAGHLDKAKVFPTIDAAVEDFLKKNPVDSANKPKLTSIRSKQL